MGGMGGGVASLFKDASVLNHAIKPGTTARIMRFARPFASLLSRHFPRPWCAWTHSRA